MLIFETKILLFGYVFNNFLFNIYAQNPVVDTQYGSVEGRAITLHDGSVIDSFLGVPFAKPPVGDLRFSVPEEPDLWDGTYPATDFGDACVQGDSITLQVNHYGWTRFSEDCLYLNIFTPQDPSSDELLPVMVYIHGGSYQTGSNMGTPGYFLAQKDVVVVVINYRVNVFGFAYTSDDVIPGNIGLRDQIMALQFVQGNIEGFNGDPNRVTIFGESAGGSSAGLLLVSPLAEGLFHGAILQSGTELAIWAIQPPDANPELYIIDVAGKLGCPVDDTQLMLECLRQVDAEELLNTDYNCSLALGYLCGGFLPVVDGALLPDKPSILREQGKFNQVPEMIGLNEDDINIFLAERYPGIQNDGVNRTMYDLYLWSRARYISFILPEPSRWEDIYQALRFYYADWPYFDDPYSNRDMMGKLETDATFGYTADLQAKYHSVNSTAYFYIYDYVNELSDLNPWVGAYHALENNFLFGFPYLQMEENEEAFSYSQIIKAPGSARNFTETDAKYADMLMTLWTNFARDGEPTLEPIETPNGTLVSWPKFTSDQLYYMDLKLQPDLKQDYRQQEYAFWREYLIYLATGEGFVEANTLPYAKTSLVDTFVNNRQHKDDSFEEMFNSEY